MSTKLEKATRPSKQFITFLYKKEWVKKTTNNLDTAISILDADHESIKTIIWNWTKFTVEELLESNF